ncbi:MAG: hypothetical protein JXQ69_05665 [Paludibacteraceae bacterium]|nr:hypothetical protein [Paludibacteraceae bacterium]MBN2787800.1 hypothetical protein [Paludibacteraceae bacterium]
MSLTPKDTKHALQIQAGIAGRIAGHNFETNLAQSINNLSCPIEVFPLPKNLIYEKPEISIAKKALQVLGWDKCHKVEAIALGALATAEDGKKWLEVNGMRVKACKSDILLRIYNEDLKLTQTVGVSIKQCSNKNPTNAQLYFTTARAFCELLRNNGIPVSDKAVNALRQFCGDNGFSPVDNPSDLVGRVSDPRRYFWEEINEEGRLELEKIFSEKQREITKLLLQKAYINDPFTPELLIHQTKKMQPGQAQEYALYSIDELISLSSKYAGFEKKKYSVKKGSYVDPVGIEHDAPRFGVVQMQRGGQQQHPEQLQFNLQAGYFYKI